MEWNLNCTSAKEAEKELIKHGFKFIRNKGDHKIYSDGNNTFVLTNSKKRFSKYTWAHTIRDLERRINGINNSNVCDSGYGNDSGRFL